MSVSVVVPIYNEVENIPLLHEAIRSVMQQLDRPWELILVNDGSKDGSSAALAKLAAEDAHVKVIEFRRNYGQTAAMQAGIQAASFDVTVMLDGDLQNDPTDIPMMLDKLDEGYDLVHGWRKNRQDTFINRKLPSKIANWIISKVTGFPVHDLGCSLKAIRTEIAQELQLYGEMHRFIPILAHWRGARCVEVVTNHHARRFGQSKYGISRTTRVILDLLTVKYFIHYVQSPMKLFGMIGLLCGAVSALACATTVGMKITSGVDMTGNPLLLLTALSAMLGAQFLFMGMLGELCSRIFFEVRGMPNYAIRKTLNFEEPSVPAFTSQRRAA
ncbi:MAG: glycosyltransferase family 2 protein [Planctomycetaceae bacterium]|nr:glycosyltransferase family 2 protein [Planctomycetaceae bacterium]